MSEQATWLTFEVEAMPHADRLFRLAMWLERDRTEAEDLVRETLIQALQSFHRYKPGTNCRAWLVTILQHVRANRRRARGRAPVDVGIGDDWFSADAERPCRHSRRRNSLNRTA